MAGMFCSIEEAAQRLAKAPDEIKEMIKLGTLREFRDGPNLLLKVNEIEEVAKSEGIELPAELPADEVQAPPPLATIPTTLDTQPEEAVMEEPEIPELEDLELSAPDDADLDIPELDALEPAALEDANLDIPELDALEPAALDAPELDLFEADMPDLELPDLAAVGSEDEIPALADDGLLSDIPDEPIAVAQIPVAEPKAKGKKKKAPKPKKQKKARPIKMRATKAPGRSFGQWLVQGLRRDSLVAVLVLIMLLGLAAATVIAIGLGANYAVENLL